jgi:hypothetical protein
MTALWGMHFMLNNDEPEKAKSLNEANERSESKLVALELVLQRVCHAHGIEPGVVRRLAGAEVFVPMRPGLEPDVEFQFEIEKYMDRLLSRRG